MIYESKIFRASKDYSKVEAVAEYKNDDIKNQFGVSFTFSCIFGFQIDELYFGLLCLYNEEFIEFGSGQVFVYEIETMILKA